MQKLPLKGSCLSYLKIKLTINTIFGNLPMFIVNRLSKPVPKINCLLMQSHLLIREVLATPSNIIVVLFKAYFVTKHLRF